MEKKEKKSQSAKNNLVKWVMSTMLLPEYVTATLFIKCFVVYMYYVKFCPTLIMTSKVEGFHMYMLKNAMAPFIGLGNC